MINTNKEKFESLWDDFISLVRGKLLTVAKNQTITTPLANLILSNAVSSWLSEYEINGRWLMRYREEDEAKMNLVQEVLTQDMKFSEVTIKRELPDYYNYIIPTIGAGVGYATSFIFDLGKIVQVASVIVPATLLYPAVKMYRQNQKVANMDINVNLYIEQLNKFRDSVLSILS